jgi:hypothetical protein
MVTLAIWDGNLVTYTADKFNFGKFKSGGLHEKHAVGT